MRALDLFSGAGGAALRFALGCSYPPLIPRYCTAADAKRVVDKVFDA